MPGIAWCGGDKEMPNGWSYNWEIMAQGKGQNLRDTFCGKLAK
jgi:hypothetical protein